jgi:hypothetical protein
VDPRLDPVVLRALENEPAQRYQQVNELKIALEGLARSAAPTMARSRGLRVYGLRVPIYGIPLLLPVNSCRG